MFIIWGFGKQTVKVFGTNQYYNCNICHNNANYQIQRITTWFTLFFIPIIPYRKKYFMYCPICNNGIEINKEQFHLYAEMNNSADPNSEQTSYADQRYEGKTETQINYLKEMEEAEKNRQH